MSGSRRKETVHARAAAMWTVWFLYWPRHSYHRIAQHFGKADQSLRYGIGLHMYRIGGYSDHMLLRHFKWRRNDTYKRITGKDRPNAK